MKSRKPSSHGAPNGVERRKGRDRRQVDKGPPAGRERRVGIEPRRPEVKELDLSASEWGALQEELKRSGG